MEEVLLNVTGLVRRYGQQTAVNGVGLTIRRGDVYGLVGQNGAGKTTLMRLICGLSMPDAGTIELMGETDAAGLSRARSRMGSIVETPRFYPNLTALQNLEYYRLQRGIAQRDCTVEALRTVGLADSGTKKFRDFSLGMKQRLGLALAILSRPDLVILDEPVNGLDPTGIIEVRDIIRRLASVGVSLLVSSHILSELSQVVSRYGFMRRGSLVQQISGEELARSCRRALEINVDDTAAAATLLETQLSTRDYKIVGANALRLYSHLDQPAAVVQTLVAGGVAVSRLGEVGDSLEDFYRCLIEEEGGDGGGS
ncbi:MAG: ATP-binding cassette domain-containing protein, partial [Coriobacteriales bacterium]|nr:ATP-binding cassette domain-containing protein [Coriobacteriales bacterium]